ncbi:HAD-IC family P-type ATPase [Corynebacterium sp. P5848]|uniref:HAD-IC family P-type ATPase n=1 Tax=Corynebacterium marambiense TaxID=2765364 RepID=UPI002260FA93|nr:HAD-IC family P-type ATPase [Corynebacterium marambiense]MCX7542338.1 HAD-IC family P-type ATPase [Corynebacterium marambiense]
MKMDPAATAVATTGHTTGPEGLDSASVRKRVESGQINHAVRRTGRSVADIVRSNVFTRINAILGVLLVIVLSTGSIINAAFGLLIIANSAIGIIQELRAKRTLDRLTILGESRPRVIRDGQTTEIVRDEIVLDDLIDIGPGDQIVVDGYVRSADGLEVDESMLTGESDAVVKQSGDAIRSGSYVTAGSGTFQATAIGEDSYQAKLIAEAGRFTLTNSQLMDGINQILRIITWLLIPTGVLTVWTQLGRTGAPWKEAVLSMVAALVPMVPEGLVLMTSIAFAVGVVRLGKRKALINELPAIEGLARVDLVCADKTGTLTENRMELDEIAPVGDHDDVELVRRVLASIAAADGHQNDTMQAISGGVADLDPDEVVATVPFDSARKWSGVSTVAMGDWVLGAPDVLTADGDGALTAVEPYIDRGLRVLMLCRATALGDVSASPAAPGCASLTPSALVVLRQKIREDAEETLGYFAREGVEVKVISGDNAVSVGAVAASLGLEGKVVDARELPAADDPDFARQVTEGTVFGRVTPEQKRDMVGVLQAAGHTVAMTGDGVNDVLALKDASIGVAMGSGSPATRSVAQVVLLDNRFATLPHVVAEGRRVIGNIERVANLFLTKTIYSIVLALVVGLFGMTFPFQPIHVTMIGWFTIGIPAFILSLAPNHERARPGFVSRVLRLALPSGLLIGLFTVAFWILVNPGTHAPDSAVRQAGTATLTVTLVMALWVLAVVARPYQWWRIALIVSGAVAYVTIFSVPPLARLLFLDASDPGLLFRALVVGGVGAVLIEASWWIGQKRSGMSPRVFAFGE